MRKLSLLLLLITTTIFSSCKKDNPDKKTTDKLVGKWYNKSVSYKEYTNSELTSEDSYTSEVYEDFLEFRSNGTGIDSDGDEFTYKVTGTKLVVLYSGEDNRDIEEEIRKITSGELVLYREHSHTNDNITYKTTWEMTYIRK